MIVDLSHPIRRGGFVYPGFPAPEVVPFRSHVQKGRPYGPNTSFAMTRINAVTNIGTYLDSPYHRHEKGPDFTGVNSPPPSGSPVSVHVSHGSSTAPTQLPEDLTVTNAADTTCK